MADKAINNPYLKVYDAIFELLFGGDENPLAGMIKVNNRISFGTDTAENRNVMKDRLATADAPEAILIDEGGMLNPHANSSGMSYIQNLAIYISTGDFRYSVYASVINWWITCNIQKWGKVLKDGLTWNGLKYVKNIQIVPVQISESNPERNRNLSGFNCIWRLQLELRIDNTNITYSETTGQ